MLETYLFNSGSLVFGLVAWILPVINLAQRHKSGTMRGAVFAAVSLTACAAALCLQIFELHHRVGIHDWSALLDTSRAVSLSAVLLLVVTLVLNAVALAKNIERQPKN
jgi:cytochrome c oxidase subunit 4